MRMPCLAAAALALGLLVVPNAISAAPVNVLGARIPLYFDHPENKRAGSLIYRGGLLLASPDRSFGGWSDIAVSADGSEMLAISDEAHWLGAHLVEWNTWDYAFFDDP